MSVFSMWRLSLAAILILLLAPTQGESGQTFAEMRWQCDNGEYISFEERCDGVKQCSDGSDETARYCIHFVCPLYAFRCTYGACISGVLMCNGVSDCADNSDESSHHCSESFTFRDLSGSCNSTKLIECKSGKCINAERLCDGLTDCPDGSDETVETCNYFYCPPYAFRCGYGACIAGNKKCNGVSDCLDGSDEAPELCGYDRGQVIPTTERTTDAPQEITEAITEEIMGEWMPSEDGCRVPTDVRNLVVEDAKTNKHYRSSEKVPSGTVIRVRCVNEPEDKENECRGSKWTQEFPTCIQYCLQSTIRRGISTVVSCFYKNKKADCSATLLPGTKAHVSCAPSYMLASKKTKNVVLTCDEDGEWDYPKFRCIPECGHVEASAAHLEFPWYVSIFRLSSTAELRRECTGSIISPKMVITAASCFNRWTYGNYNPVYYSIVAGNYANSFRHSDQLERSVYNISEILTPTRTTFQTTTQNIALLVLVNHFVFSVKLHPICLEFVKVRDLSLEHLNSEIADLSSFNRTQPLLSDIGSAVMSLSRKDQQRYRLTKVVSAIAPDGRISMLNVDAFSGFIINNLQKYYPLY